MTPGNTEQKHNRGIVVEVRLNQFFTIGNTKIIVEKKYGQVARLRVVAEEGIVITPPEKHFR